MPSSQEDGLDSSPKPFPHQQFAADWVFSNPRCLLADQMGLGKTGSSILGLKRAGTQRILVVCPAVARRNWVREFSIWWPGKLAVPLEDGASTSDFGAFLGLTDDGVFTVSYSLASTTQFIAAIYRWKPDAIVFDEAHALKNPESKRTAYLYGAKHALANAARRVVSLTGTPMPNHAGELYPHFRALAPHLIADTPSYEAFLSKYCDVVPTAYGQKVLGSRLKEQLAHKLSTFMLRREAKDVLDLPPLVWATRLVDAERHGADPGDVGDQEAARIMLEEAEEFSTIRRLTGEIKAPVIAGMAVDAINTGALKKLVLFGHHRSVLNKMQDVFDRAGIGSVVVSGETTPKLSDARIQMFRDVEGCKVFIGQLDACSTAINLQAARHLWFCECSWVPGTNDQASKRIHRIGQNEPCFITVFSLADSLDQAINRVVARKIKDIDSIVKVTTHV